eukprot:TRINITY_DN103585_c0_g1_i1.p2 TRINITY_DN103585_c0_g1~~TRINITY_DN103585_c0_g1_i1.p2  ORF type:complete len:113 (-),score=4.14 TRINITY_DN103585_c0_g1_i1:216-554(-)
MRACPCKWSRALTLRVNCVSSAQGDVFGPPRSTLRVCIRCHLHGDEVHAAPQGLLIILPPRQPVTLPAPCATFPPQTVASPPAPLAPLTPWLPTLSPPDVGTTRLLRALVSI